MDEQSGETEEEEVIGEVVGESELEELVPAWGYTSRYSVTDRRADRRTTIPRQHSVVR